VKEPRDWDEEYILTSLPAGEFDWFEAKGSQVVKPESKEFNREVLSKAISALANFGGGTLVLGIKQAGRNWIVDDGGISNTVGRTTTKEWLEDIIPNLVELPLQTFNVSIPKRSADTTIAAGKEIYIIQVGESSLAPHQACDNVYYGRVGGKSKPLGHRMVLDILNRRQYPHLEINFSLAFVDEKDPNIHKVEGQHRVLTIQIENKGPVFAQFVNSVIYIPEYLVEPAAIRTILDGIPLRKDGNNYIRILRENVIPEILSNDKQVVFRGPGRYTPILPGRKHSWDIPLINDYYTHSQFFKDDIPKLLWEIYADNAQGQKGEFSFKQIKMESNLKYSETS
jgi:hypothetical protein